MGFLTVFSPAVSAEAYLVAEAESGIVLYEQAATGRMYPASTTKILTALVCLENCDLSDVVEISEAAAATEGSGVGMTAGETASVEDLLYLLLLKSENDAAVALAEHISGSVAKFADKMNEKAALVGCVDSHFVNPHGLPDGEHYTTAADLCTLTRAALAHPVFRKIVGTTVKKLDYRSLVIANSNRLLTEYDGALGVKTGYTKAAGRCLVSAAERDGVTLICVTLNAPDDWADHRALLDGAFGRVERRVLLEAGAYRAVRPVLNGSVEFYMTNVAPLTELWVDGAPVSGEYRENLPVVLRAPIRAGTVCGSLELLYDGKTVSAVDLVCLWDVPQGQTAQGFWGRFWAHLRYLLQNL